MFAILSILGKVLGVLDLITAYIIVSKDFGFLGISFIIALILIIKGITSMFADTLSRIYGFIDILVGFLILFGVAPFPLDIVLFIFMLYKGLISLI